MAVEHFSQNPLGGDQHRGGVQEGRGLCLSGGGYRAMLFHLGTLWRLYEAGKLKSIDRISSVSGGSITAAKLALAWPSLSFDPARVRTDFVRLVVEPIQELAGRTLDSSAIIQGLLLPGSAADRITNAYREHLLGNATLQDLPQAPRFIINATNVQSGALWRFSRPYMGDYRVGRIYNPELLLASAVTASSSFPPLLSPLTLKLDPADFATDTGEDLQKTPYTSQAVLCDGGVYDNMGMETVWKRYRTVLISDAGAKMQPQAEPHHDWLRHAYRVSDIVDNQVRSLRKRQVLTSFYAQPGSPEHRYGAYWSIRSDIARFPTSQTLLCPYEATKKLASISTRLKRLDRVLQERLINWGYAVCDAALKAHVEPDLAQGTFPFPKSGVG